MPKHAELALHVRRRPLVTSAVVVATAALCATVALATGGDRPARAARAASPAAVETSAPASPSVTSSTSTSPVPPAAAPRPAPAVPIVVPASTLAADGIPTTALDAYRNGSAMANRTYPRCRIGWPLLAAIGRVESDHGRFAGAVLHVDGVSTPRIVGIPLNGNGTELVRDTDHGRLDGDPVYDRAVGPMQFIPSTWATWAVDGNHDGVSTPNNIYDAAAAAGNYLCAAGGDLTTYVGQRRAVLAYNHSTDYLNLVLDLERTYAQGVMTVPIAPGPGDARLAAVASLAGTAPVVTAPRPVAPHPGSPVPGTPTPRSTSAPTPTPTPTPTPAPSKPPCPTASATAGSPSVSTSVPPSPAAGSTSATPGASTCAGTSSASSAAGSQTVASPIRSFGTSAG